MLGGGVSVVLLGRRQGLGPTVLRLQVLVGFGLFHRGRGLLCGGLLHEFLAKLGNHHPAKSDNIVNFLNIFFIEL